jgi:hypothetical protein
MPTVTPTVMPIIILPRHDPPGETLMASNRQRKLNLRAYPARAKTTFRPLVLAAEPSTAAPTRTILRKIAVFGKDHAARQKRRDYMQFRSKRSRPRAIRPPQTAGGWPSMRVATAGRRSHSKFRGLFLRGAVASFPARWPLIPTVMTNDRWSTLEFSLTRWKSENSR